MSDMDENINMEHHLSEYEISLVADATQSGEYEKLDAKIKTHLAACIHCKAQVIELTEMLNAMDEANISENPQRKKISLSNRKREIWKLTTLAASIVLLIISSLYYWQDRKDYEIQIADLEEDLIESSETSTARKNDSLNLLINEMESSFQHQIEAYSDSVKQAKIELEEQQELLATLYKPNPLLEEEMQLNLRSHSISLSSPEQEIYSIGEKIQFTWNDKAISNLNLILYNNMGLAVIQENNIKNGYTLPLQKLTLGTYYWQLFQENEMVAMGKIELR